MPAEYVVLFGVPISAGNLALMRRAGVLVHCKNISGQDRLDYFNQVITLAQLKALYPSEVADIDAQLLNFQALYSTSDPPITQDRYVGQADMTTAQWERAVAIFSSLPGTFRFARFDQAGLLINTNTTLAPGTYYPHRTAVAALGLKPYQPAGDPQK